MTPPPELLEAVARALHGTVHMSARTWDRASSANKACFRSEAQAVFTAISEAGFVVVPREPTQEMIEAGADVAGVCMDGECPADHIAGEAYRAMLAARPGGGE